MDGLWIWDAYHQYAPNTYAVLRKSFFLEDGKNITSVKIKSASSGEYKVFLNGSYLFRGGLSCNEGYQYIDGFSLECGRENILSDGKNTIAVLCYYYGKGLQFRTMDRAGFIFEMEITYEGYEKKSIASDDSWKITFPFCFDTNSRQMMYSIGFQEIVDLRKYDTLIFAPHYNDDTWVEKENADNNTAPSSFMGDIWEYATIVTDYNIKLTPREITFLRETEKEIVNCIDSGQCLTDYNSMKESNIADIISTEEHLEASDYCIESKNGKYDIRSPVKNHAGAAYLVFDLGQEESGYFSIDMESGFEGVIDFGYSECLDENGRVDCTRQKIRQADRLIVGKGKYSYKFFNRRAFRYMQITLRGKDIDTSIVKLTMSMLSYPFEKVARFVCDDLELNGIFNISKHTLDICMKEVFEDCPLRERSQYLGDMRVQALMNYYTFGNFELIKQAFNQYAREQRQDGWVKTLVPGSTQHNIVDYLPFLAISLWDYYLFSGDKQTLSDLFTTISKTMKWMLSNTNESGLIPKKSDFWIFIDWSQIQKRGIVTAFQCVFYQGLITAAKIARTLGHEDDQKLFIRKAHKAKNAINEFLWDSARGMYCDCMDQGMEGYSIQTNIFAIIFNVADSVKKSILKSTLKDVPNKKIQTGYFKFYELEMLYKMKEYRQFAKTFDYWKGMMRLGAKTWWETFDQSANKICPDSLCHAWSAAPLYHIPSKILGIRPLSAGFEKILIKPNMFGIKKCEALLPTAMGDIRYKFDDTGINTEIEIEIPGNTEGFFIFKDRMYEIDSGKLSLLI